MTWASPMPRRMGGRSTQTIADLYAAAKAGGGSLISDGPEAELENIVLARMVAAGRNAARARACQGDPLRLSDDRRPVTLPDGATESLSPLERWERALRLRPPMGATVTQRRRAVLARRSLSGECVRGVIQEALNDVFAPWLVSIPRLTADILTLTDAYWPLGANTAAYPGSPPSPPLSWMSGCYTLYASATSPAGTPAAEENRRKGLAAALLEDILPAHADYFLVIL